MKTRTHLGLGVTITTLLVGVSTDVSADCDYVHVKTEEELFNAHGCEETPGEDMVDFLLWSVASHNMNHDDWGTRGWHDACNYNRELAKHWNAIYLLHWGIMWDQGFAGRAFHHGVWDYSMITRGNESAEWHTELRHQVVDVLCNDPNCVDQALNAWVGRPGIDLVQSSCSMYDVSHLSSGFFANPVWRVNGFIHEGWHSWKDHHFLPSGHDEPSTGQDWFFPHQKSDYYIGEMHMEKGGRGRSHSVNQAAFEAVCDIADMPAAQIPFSVRELAGRLTRPVNAKTQVGVMTTTFLNPVAAMCGTPELVAGPPPGTPPPTTCTKSGRSTCTSDAQCPSGWCGISDACCYLVH